jgi:hypothetical protein
MSLNVDRLERVVRLANGGVEARCPACAESGNDRKGEHLRISPEGKFGCCVFPGDRQHRKRIFALAGDHGPKEIKVRVAVAASPAVQTGILGRLSKPVEPENCSDVSDGVSAVQTEFEEIGTAETESVETVARETRTARTGHSLLTRNAVETDSICKLVEFDTPVRSVRLTGPVPTTVHPEKPRLPYLTTSGDLVIPFDSPERYHWWKPPHGKRLRVGEIVAELRERKENDAAPF